MREIKFRVWDKHLKLIRKVSYIDFDGKEIMFYADDFEENEDCSSLDIVRDFEEINIMQYTGLKDTNGVEIYEGDIVEYIDGEYSFVGIVKNTIFGLYAIDNNDNYKFEDFADENTMTAEVKVIGNIHENMKLLEAK